MPGPFPGMDPYLEHPGRFSGLHLRLINRLGDTLNAQLPERYVANIGERVYVVEPQRSLYPDIFLVERPTMPRDGGSVAVACDPPLVVQAEPYEVREAFVEILTSGAQGDLITVIEVLSPTNKTPGAEGWTLYDKKQLEILSSRVHLLEIDLLREGKHRLAVPIGMLPPPSTWNYLVSLHRGGDGTRYQIWPITLEKRLPRILVPLGKDDPDMVVDLQEVFDHCYDVGRYAGRLDYRQPCQPPLEGDQAAWADALLKEKKLR